MSNIWHDISPSRIQPEDFVAVIEIPKGSKKKYELDKETGLIILDRVLHNLFQYNGFASLHAPMARHLAVTGEEDPCSL